MSDTKGPISLVIADVDGYALQRALPQRWIGDLQRLVDGSPAAMDARQPRVDGHRPIRARKASAKE